MRILGLDWGEKRIGVAISDPLGITALPLPHLENNKKIFSDIQDIATKNSVNEIVIGLPKNMNGTEGASAEKVRSFKDSILAKLALNVTLWDERLTSKMAERTLIDSGTSRTKRKDLIDSMSASMMLQSYMDQRKK